VAPGESPFRLHIGALAVLEREPPDDDAAGRALTLLRRTGDAERMAAGGLVAGFDTPAAAVAAATAVHRSVRTAGTEGWRAGVEVGELLLTPGDSASRAAIERATELARLARPGTTAVGAEALPALGPLRDARVETLHAPHAAHLIVPLEPVDPLRRRRLLMLLVVGAALGGAATIARVMRRATNAERRRVTLGVGPFAFPRTDPEHAWIGHAVRSGLNTQLSELSDVKENSQAFIDYLMRSEGLSEIELAALLGIEKMLSGSVLVVGDSIRVEAQIIDVASGVLDASYATVGREQDFLALENEVVLGIIARLHLPLSPEDERRLAARRESNPNALRRLLDSEGADPAPAPAPRDPDDPSSGLFAPREAFAADAEAEVTTLLEQYRRALERRDVPALGSMYVTFSPAQQAALERYFASVRDLRVGIVDVDIVVNVDDGVVSYTRIDDFVDVETRQPQHLSLRVTRALRRVDGRWHFAGTR
jgi:TolB-like protein